MNYAQTQKTNRKFLGVFMDENLSSQNKSFAIAKMSVTDLPLRVMRGEVWASTRQTKQKKI